MVGGCGLSVATGGWGKADKSRHATGYANVTLNVYLWPTSGLHMLAHTGHSVCVTSVLLTLLGRQVYLCAGRTHHNLGPAYYTMITVLNVCTATTTVNLMTCCFPSPAHIHKNSHYYF